MALRYSPQVILCPHVVNCLYRSGRPPSSGTQDKVGFCFQERRGETTTFWTQDLAIQKTTGGLSRAYGAPEAFDMAVTELNGVSMTFCRRRESANGDCRSR